MTKNVLISTVLKQGLAELCIDLQVSESRKITKRGARLLIIR